MTLSLSYSPYAMMEKYMRMKKHGDRDRYIIKVLSELNAIGIDDTKKIIANEQSKIDAVGIEEYRRKYNYKPDNGRYTYEI